MLKRILFCLLVSVSLSGFSQSEDFRTWWAAELRGELLNTIDFKVTPEIRFVDNSTHLSSIITDFDASSPFLQYFRIGGQYRYKKINIKNEYQVNRFGLYLKARYKFKSFRLGYRALYHWEYVGINTREGGAIPYQYHRHKISMAYYKKKWDLRPGMSVEYFLNHKPVETIYEQKLRLTIGLDYIINKRLSVSMSYKYQEEFFVNRPLTAHILATKISYRL